MERTRTSLIGSMFAFTALAAAVSSAGCQDVHTFVTGERFLAPPEESPRVEIELVVEVPDSFFDALQGEDEKELALAISERVLGLADVGMRFYPVPTDEYGRGDAHPPYRLSVSFEDLIVDIDHEMIEEEDQAPRIESSVRDLGCSATAVVEKRRDDAPALVVGTGRGIGKVRVHAPDPEAAPSPTYDVTRASRDDELLTVSREDVLLAVEKAALAALREIVKPVDRELSQESAPLL